LDASHSEPGKEAPKQSGKDFSHVAADQHIVVAVDELRAATAAAICSSQKAFWFFPFAIVSQCRLGLTSVLLFPAALQDFKVASTRMQFDL
jgi:hypothetical protein